ncbi:hypothetical protein HZC53_02555 [Candidatus Uhrbacteria bacterium]|nr:hypothetical protein [Candidatus Uhrbacteria bacterium]
MLNRTFAVASLAVASFVSTAAMAQTPDAATVLGNPAGITTDASLCQNDGECQKALARCEENVRIATAGAAAALDATRECRAQLIRTVPPPKKAPPAPPACSGPHAKLVNGTCECHVGEDGSGDIDPGFVAVHKFGGGNLVVCVSGHDALDLAREFKRRFENEVAPNVPGWNTTRDNLNVFLTTVNVPNADPKVLAANWNELWGWYQGEKSRQDRIKLFLDNDLPRINSAVNTLCPPIAAKPDASMEERCTEAMNSVRDTKVEFRAGARGGFIHAPGSGVGAMAVASAEFEYHATQKTSVVVGGYFGGINDGDTGGQFLYGVEIGPRFYLDDERRAALDILVYGQGRTSVHGGGYHGMPTGFMGKDVGLRPRLSYCFGDTRAFCVSADVSGGYGTQNYWKSPYSMGKETGAVWTGGLGIHGHTRLY